MKTPIKISVIVLFSLFSCKKENINKNAESTLKTQTTGKNVIQTLKTGDHSISFQFDKDWVPDDKSSAIPPTEKDLIKEQVGYTTYYTTKASMATMIYRHGNRVMDAEGAINGMVNSLSADPTISVKNQKL